MNTGTHLKTGRPIRSIQFYKGGVKLFGDPVVGNPKGKGGGKRGKVSGFSKASKRSMREALLTKTGPENFIPCGLTITIPGPVATVVDSKRCWDKFRLWIKDKGHCGFWRIEIQERGALHWHLILWLDPDRLEEVTSAWYREKGCDGGLAFMVKLELQKGWFKAIDSMGPCSGPCSTRRNGKLETGILEVQKRSDWWGAEDHAVDVQFDDGRGAWLRYLQDHTTKSKQEQIPDNIGHHWGKINGGKLVSALPLSSIDFGGKEWFAFLRSYQRLCTSSVRCEDAPFGRRLRRRLRRGSVGASVWFSKASTVERLARFFHSKPEPVNVSAAAALTPAH